MLFRGYQLIFFSTFSKKCSNGIGKNVSLKKIMFYYNIYVNRHLKKKKCFRYRDPNFYPSNFLLLSGGWTDGEKIFFLIKSLIVENVLLLKLKKFDFEYLLFILFI